MNATINYPLVLQESWILESIIKNIKKNEIYTNSTIAKNFISFSHSSKAPILRILRFLKTTRDCDLTAILTDSTHKVIGIFPFSPTIIDFEVKYKQRITYHTLNSLVLIKQANLKFVNNVQLMNEWGVSIEDDIDVAVLEILDLEIFQRDQITLGINIENNLPLVYYDKSYLELCERRRPRDLTQEKEVQEVILQNYDDVLSI